MGTVRLALAVIVTLLAMTASVPADRADRADRQPATALPVVPDAAPTEAAASLAAHHGGKSVLIESMTDETTQVRANPNGSMTMVQHVRPVRVRRGDRWVPVDTTLGKTGAGVIGPQATIVDLELSPGGPAAKGKPAVLVRKGSNAIGLGWEGELPEPILSGPNATYPEVLPGVDLRITADVTGFSEVLVVKTREAARNPKLRRIAFGTHATGVTVSAAGRGGIRAADTSGKVVFSGDASRMWDSAEQRRGATMGVEVTGAAVTIVPDQDFLADKETSYPVYLDPSYPCTDCGKAHHVVTQEAFPTSHNWDRTDDVFGDLKAGYWCVPKDCPRTNRTFLSLRTASLFRKDIQSAVLHVTVVNSANCGTAAQPTNLALMGGIDFNTTWANQPAVFKWLGSGNRTNNSQFCPSDGGMDLDALAGVQDAAAIGWSETTFGLFGSREGGDSSAWRRFDLNPYLVVTYNSWPNEPTDLGIEGWGPNPGDAIPCATGANRPFVPIKEPRLRGKISDPDGGMMEAGFRIYPGPVDEGDWDGNQAWEGEVPSGSFAKAPVDPGVIVNDGIYTWNMWAGDYDLETFSESCEFELDTKKPAAPTLTSNLYPPDKAAGGVGQTGTFTFTAGTATNDSAFYEYAFTEQGGAPRTKVTPTKLNGPVTISWTPTVSGPQTLTVRAIDRAGNRSDDAKYKVLVSDYQVGVSGKIAQWSLDGNLSDTSGAKTLTYEGAPPSPPFGTGHTGKGLVLDPNDTGLLRSRDALVRTDNSFTVSAWVRLNSADRQYIAVAQEGEQQSGFYLGYQPDVRRWAILMSDKDEPSPTWRLAASADPPTLGAWTHVAGVFDANFRTLRIYVNGQRSGEGAGPPSAWNATGLFLVGAGKASGRRTDYFGGAIDSVRVHARALGDAEVAALHAGTATASPTAEYLFEDTLTNSGANNDLGQSAAAGYTPGYAGSALNVDPGASPVALTTGPLVNTTGSFTVAGWVKVPREPNYYTVVSQDGQRASGFLLRYGLDRWGFGLAKTDTDNYEAHWAVGQPFSQPDAWTHVTAVHDAGAHKMLLYVNGRLDAQSDVVATVDARGPFVLGGEKFNGNRAGGFRGQLDELTVYDGALKPDEVARLANAPVERARYALNETNGTVAHDSVSGAQGSLYGTGVTWGQRGGFASAGFTGNRVEHSGTVAGGPPVAQWSLNNSLTDGSGNGRTLTHGTDSAATPVTYAGGQIDNGVKLNGTNQRLATSGPVVDTTKSYSVSAWVKLDHLDRSATVLSQEVNGFGNFSLSYKKERNAWVFGVLENRSGGSVLQEAVSPLPAMAGVWVHLLGVYDAAAGMARLYVNGHFHAEARVATVWLSSGPLWIGRQKWNGLPSQFLPGVVDEIRVYDRALSASDAHGLWDLSSNIIVPRPPALRTDQSFVLAAWARLDDYTQTHMVVAVDGNRLSPVMFGYFQDWKRWGVRAFSGSEAQPQPVLKYVVSDREATTYTNPDGWVHLAVVYDAPARQVRLYVNGVRQSSTPSGSAVVPDPRAGADMTLWDGGRELVVGRGLWEGMSLDQWKGAIRDVRVFSGVLPEACDNVPNCMSQLPRR